MHDNVNQTSFYFNVKARCVECFTYKQLQNMYRQTEALMWVLKTHPETLNVNCRTEISIRFLYRPHSDHRQYNTCVITPFGSLRNLIHTFCNPYWQLFVEHPYSHKHSRNALSIVNVAPLQLAERGVRKFSAQFRGARQISTSFRGAIFISFYNQRLTSS